MWTFFKFKLVAAATMKIIFGQTSTTERSSYSQNFINGTDMHVLHYIFFVFCAFWASVTSGFSYHPGYARLKQIPLFTVWNIRMHSNENVLACGVPYCKSDFILLRFYLPCFSLSLTCREYATFAFVAECWHTCNMQLWKLSHHWFLKTFEAKHSC